MANAPKPTSTKKTKRSTTRAASTTPKAAAKTAPKATIVSTKAAPASGMSSDAPELTKKEMVARMVAQSGMKKGDARRGLEATMAALSDALREGNNLSLAPLGKIKIARSKDTPNGRLVVLRVKLKDPVPATPKDPLAAASE